MSKRLRPIDFISEPIIIGGCGRSGTTLLLAILGAHPNIFAIPEETQIFCPQAYDFITSEDFSVNAGSKRLTRESIFELQMKHLDLALPISVQKLQSVLESIPAGYQRWCEKTPKNVLFFNEIITFFSGKIRLVHIVRDGRDVVTSIHPGRSEYHVPINRWATEVAHGLAMREHPCVLTLKYEDLVLNFEKTVLSLCSFLGEPFHDNLRSWTKYTNIKFHDSFHGQHPVPLYLHAIGRWKDSCYRARIDEFMANQKAVACLKALGYE